MSSSSAFYICCLFYHHCSINMRDDTDDLFTWGNKPFGNKTYAHNVADLMAEYATSQSKIQEIKKLEVNMTEW